MISNNNILNFELKHPANTSKFQLIKLIFILFLVLIYATYDALENNKRTSIECNKQENICIFKEHKFFFGTKTTQLPFDLLGNAYLHLVGCTRGTCSYNLVIPSINNPKLKLINLYNNTEDKALLDWTVQHFNDFKNNSKLNDFRINSGKHFIVTVSVIAIPLFSFVIILFIFFIGSKETLILDKNNDEIRILLDRIIWAKVRRFKISQIKNLSYNQENLGTRFYIKYTLESSKQGKLLYMYHPDDELKPIYNQMNEFIFGQNEDNNIISEETKQENNLEI